MDLATVVVAAALVLAALLVKRALRIALLAIAAGCLALRFGVIPSGTADEALAGLLHLLPFNH